jgi:hypothetical protein
MASTLAPSGLETSDSLDDRLAMLRASRGPAVADFCRKVRELVVVASSSRGGSSVVAELLRYSLSLIHLRAEMNPFLRLAGLDFPRSGSGSDELDAGHVERLDRATSAMLGEELSLDAGFRCDVVDDERFALDVLWRLSVQWPALSFDRAGVLALVRGVLAWLRREKGWAPGEIRDVPLFHSELLHALRDNGVPVSLRYYDLPRRLLRDAPEVQGAPGACVIEEPPFVFAYPWRSADEHDLATKPLVVKTPSNAYRFDFLRALFPRARLRIVHLTRNPAAAINGLYDGWWHTGFHTYRMPNQLRIAGYAEDFEPDRWWWKFDLPPGWTEYTDAPLLDVCGFQWRASHEAILAEIGRGGTSSIQMRFEDVTWNGTARMLAFERLSDWLGIPFDGAFRRVVAEGIGPIAMTVPPRRFRWHARADAVQGAIRGQVRSTMERLGYDREDEWL